MPKDSKQYGEVKKALDAIGTSGDKNGVLVSFGQSKTGGTMETSGKNITVDFERLDAGIARYQNAGYKTDVGVETAAEVTHEGIHLTREAPTWAANKWDIADNIEREAYGAQSGVSEAGGSESIVWNNSWAASADKETLRQNAVKSAAASSERVFILGAWFEFNPTSWSQKVLTMRVAAQRLPGHHAWCPRFAA